MQREDLGTVGGTMAVLLSMLGKNLSRGHFVMFLFS